jgi:RNA recognition motif-containing protein
MIDRKTLRSRGFGFVYLSEGSSVKDAISNMHGVLIDNRKISVTRAVPETQTMPGTPANLLAAGRGIRRGVRGSHWEGDGPRSSPRPQSRLSSRNSRYGSDFPTKYALLSGPCTTPSRNPLHVAKRRDHSQTNVP